jgi:large subunit ribosomal protein L32e
MSEKEFEKPATERALALRQRHKSKKPKFRRQESWRYKRVSEVWRKPDGIDSTMRKKMKGWPKSAQIGYRGPKVARGLHPSGYAEVLVRTVDDLNKVDPKTQAIRIAHTVGMKKRAEISVRADERGVHVLNPLPEVKPEEAPKETEAETEAEEATEEKEEEEKES